MTGPDHHTKSFPEIDSSSLLVQADVPLRHQLMAHAFGIERPHEFEDWYKENNQELQDILEGHYKRPVTLLDARDVRKSIHANIRTFKDQAFYRERMPFIISLDPVVAAQEHADYIYQESRVSLVDVNEPFIDLEHNGRGYVNRFVGKVGLHNGAGKPLMQQRVEVKTLINAHEKHSLLDIALVDGYSNSGKSIIDFGKIHRVKGTREHEQAVILGALNNTGAENLREADIRTFASIRFNSAPAKCIDQTDMIPTLGGRVIGWRLPHPENVDIPIRAFSVGRFAVHIPVAVDAITGNYPWQVDITEEEMSPTFRRKLFEYSTNTAHSFWTSLERARGAEILWGDLSVLNGLSRVFYPARDKQDLNDIRYPLANGPLEAVERIIKDNVYV